MKGENLVPSITTTGHTEGPPFTKTKITLSTLNAVFYELKLHCCQKSSPILSTNGGILLRNDRCHSSACNVSSPLSLLFNVSFHC